MQQKCHVRTFCCPLSGCHLAEGTVDKKEAENSWRCNPALLLGGKPGEGRPDFHIFQDSVGGSFWGDICVCVVLTPTSPCVSEPGFSRGPSLSKAALCDGQRMLDFKRLRFRDFRALAEPSGGGTFCFPGSERRETDTHVSAGVAGDEEHQRDPDL